MKIYGGFRGSDGVAHVFVKDTPNSVARPLAPRFDLRRHSPAGFEWGYGGSGPAQLALAILYDVTLDSRLTLQHYQDYKAIKIAAMPSSEPWAITEAEVREWIDKQRRSC